MVYVHPASREQVKEEHHQAHIPGIQLITYLSMRVHCQKVVSIHSLFIWNQSLYENILREINKIRRQSFHKASGPQTA